MTHHGTFWDCCEVILDNRTAPALNYAVNYANAGLYMTCPHEHRVQALYILNNIQQWRGDDAKAVRASLKIHAKYPNT